MKKRTNNGKNTFFCVPFQMLVMKMLGLSRYLSKISGWVRTEAILREFRTKETYFTRSSAKLSFERLVAFILGNNRNSTQVALNDFFDETEDDPVAKQTLFEAREKISYKAFSALNDMIVDNFYTEDDVLTFRNYALWGVDGSVFQAPQGALEVFGGQKSSRCETVSAQARALVISDVLNRIIVQAELKPINDGERKIFLEMLENLRHFERILLIFDRGFYSKELADAIAGKGISFLFRIKNNCQKEIDAANEPDQVITVGGDLKLRIVNFVLPTGEVEKLATNIFGESFGGSDFAAIYEKRWGVETSYLMVKERLAIENFTSSKENLMLQDFYAAAVTYNLMEIACMEQEAKRKADGMDEGKRNKRSANRNIVAHEVRKSLLYVMLESDLAKIDKKMAKIQRIIYRFFKDVRPGRSNPRKTKFPHKKYHMNKKRNA
jgi:uncharacterized protein YlbG (UPF0298 family)